MMSWQRVLLLERIDKSFAIVGLIIAISLLAINFILLKSLLICIVFTYIYILFNIPYNR